MEELGKKKKRRAKVIIKLEPKVLEFFETVINDIMSEDGKKYWPDTRVRMKELKLKTVEQFFAFLLEVKLNAIFTRCWEPPLDETQLGAYIR